MAYFTKTQQCNRTNCEFEKYATTSNFFVLNSLAKSHLNSVCTEYICDKSENARVCAKWQWNALDWCYWIALPASPVVQSSNTVSCVSLSFRTHRCVLAIKMTSYQYRKSHCGDKTILRPSYLHNGISYTGKMTSLYWIRALDLMLAYVP